MDTKNFINQIPVNTRCIGNPNGIYVLYLEDYVDTFIKKFLYVREQPLMQSSMQTKVQPLMQSSIQTKMQSVYSKDENFDAQPPMQILLYGQRFDRNGQIVLVVYAAEEYQEENAFSEGIIRILESGSRFKDMKLIGIAIPDYSRSRGIRLEILVIPTRFNIGTNDIAGYEYSQNNKTSEITEITEKKEAAGKSCAGSPTESAIGDSAENPAKLSDDYIRSNSVKVILDDYYIFYDQNEEMQSYLVSWNEKNNIRSDDAAFMAKYENWKSGRRNNGRSSIIKNDYDHKEEKSAAWDRHTAADDNEESSSGNRIVSAVCAVLAIGILAYGVTTISSYERLERIGDGIESLAERFMSGGKNTVTTFMSEKEENTDKSDKAIIEEAPDEATNEEASGEAVSNEQMPNKAISDEAMPDEAISDEAMPDEAMSDEAMPDEAISDEAIPNEEISKEAADKVLEEVTSVEAVSEETPEEVPEDVTPVEEASKETSEKASGEAAANQSIPQYYVVQRGDTLRDICFKVYGDYEMASRVCEINKIENPDDILYGQRLLLP